MIVTVLNKCSYHRHVKLIIFLGNYYFMNFYWWLSELNIFAYLTLRTLILTVSMLFIYKIKKAKNVIIIIA